MAKLDHTNEKREYFDFEAYDRTVKDGHHIIGAMIYTFECELDGEGRTGQKGHRFGLRYSATRNRRSYGASQRTYYFLDKETRQKAIEKYLKGAQKRAEKYS